MLPRTLVSLVAQACLTIALSAQAPESVAVQYALTASTTYAFPQATSTGTADAGAFLVQNWGLSKGRIQTNPQNLAFVPDPFPNAPVSGASGSTSANLSAPVLRVDYPAAGTGGSQFLALFNSSATQEAMMLSYEVAFDTAFDFAKGGKLPGIRGGPSLNDCDSSDQSTGHNCFSSRPVWRAAGAGEIYTYILQDVMLCSSPGASCNTQFGVSIDRGTYNFVAGKWLRITMFVWMNSPTTTANGAIALYLNDMQVVNKTELQIRAGSGVTTDGMWFSTAFFAANETTKDQHTYFRNIRLWASDKPSTLAGVVASNATAGAARLAAPRPRSGVAVLACLCAATALAILGGLV